MNAIELLKTKAPKLPATVKEVASLKEAMEYIVEICLKKRPFEVLLPEEGKSYGELSENGLPTSLERILAAPDLGEEATEILKKLCADAGIAFLQDGLRQHLGGFDVGVARAEMVAADTVTCLVNSNKESVRLATMIGEICVLLAPRSKVVMELGDLAVRTRELQTAGGASYTAYITGPSRTADIERVGALGVHGPLELHIILLED